MQQRVCCAKMTAAQGGLARQHLASSLPARPSSHQALTSCQRHLLGDKFVPYKLYCQAFAIAD